MLASIVSRAGEFALLNLSFFQRRVTLLPLAAAACFMVSGGPYGIEDVVSSSGYLVAIVILIVTPIIWSVPTALMVGELASAIPDEGGYYVWVRRALGPFWGFQEAWLSLVASIFDMAIYPTLFVAYFSGLLPAFANGQTKMALGLLVIVVCAFWNLRGAGSIGRSSLLSGILLCAPFAAVCLLSLFHPGVVAVNKVNNGHHAMIMGLLVAMWNYMGWDNASTIAQEVENPQRTYPLAMALSVVAVTAIYVASITAVWHAGIDPALLTTGGWAAAAQILGGQWLKIAIVLGGCISAFGIFNSLVMSYSRIPYALAADGLLPKIFLRRSAKSGAPWFSILVCSLAWCLSLGAGFQRLVEFDMLLYGASLVLEFVALIVLRLREPNLARPFKVPYGLTGAISLAILPTFLIGLALIQGSRDQVNGVNVLSFSLLLGLAGIPLYIAASSLKKVSDLAPVDKL